MKVWKESVTKVMSIKKEKNMAEIFFCENGKAENRIENQIIVIFAVSIKCPNLKKLELFNVNFPEQKNTTF